MYVCVCITKSLCCTPPESNVYECVKSLQLMDYSLPGSFVHGDSLGKNIGVDSHALLLGIFLTQGSNPCLMSPSLGGRFFTTSATWEAPKTIITTIIMG